MKKAEKASHIAYTSPQVFSYKSYGASGNVLSIQRLFFTSLSVATQLYHYLLHSVENRSELGCSCFLQMRECQFFSRDGCERRVEIVAMQSKQADCDDMIPMVRKKRRHVKDHHDIERQLLGGFIEVTPMRGFQ